jgi:hypothetical protein
VIIIARHIHFLGKALDIFPSSPALYSFQAKYTPVNKPRIKSMLKNVAMLAWSSLKLFKAPSYLMSQIQHI